MCYMHTYYSRADLGGAWGAEAPPPSKIYIEQARKLLEPLLQVQ